MGSSLVSNTPPARPSLLRRVLPVFLVVFGISCLAFARAGYQAEQDHFLKRQAQIKADDERLAEFNKALANSPIPIINKAQPGARTVEPPNPIPFVVLAGGGALSIVMGFVVSSRSQKRQPSATTT